MPAWLEKLFKRGEAASVGAAVRPAAPLRTVRTPLAQAIALRDAGRLDEAEKQLLPLLERAPGDADLRYQLGVVLQMQGKNASAKAAYGAALALDPTHADANNNLGVILKGDGAFDQALQHHQRALAARPGSLDALNNIAVALQALGRTGESLPYFERALALRPDHAGLHYNYAAALHALARLDAAIGHYRTALQLEPGLAFAHRSLAGALQMDGRLDEAELQFRRALELDPQDAESWYALGSLLLGVARLADAVESFRKALVLRPEYAEAEVGLGMAHKELRQFAEARVHYLQALQLRPAYADAWDKLGSLHRDQGELSEALDCYRKALQLEPLFENAHHNLCFALNYIAGVPPQEIFEAHLEFARRHCEFARPNAYRNQPDPNRRLRVGYVSGDFRDHAISYFIEPVLAGHDRAGFEVVCYHNSPKADTVTERLRGHADRWENIYRLDDTEVARTIGADAIDILVDLSGHTGFNRLLALARKPAPVQATWLGYLNTTGLRAIDYRIVDFQAAPPGLLEAYHSEQLVRMPHSQWCYQPPADCPEVSGLPAAGSGYITFASFHGLAKITPSVIELWSRLLARMPGSRLLAVANGVDAIGGKLLQRFARHGIAAERIQLHEFKSFDDYLAMHNEVDISLDTHPYTGGTTTCHALWMGVPVVTMTGTTAPSRGGASVLAAVGLSELVADSAEDYVSIAAQLAGDPPRLAKLRAGLRQRTRTSHLCDAAGFTRDLEAIYRIMWKKWCAQP